MIYVTLFLVSTLVGSFFAYYYMIDELTLKEIYNLKIKTKFPFLLSKQDYLLLKSLEILKNLNTHFKNSMNEEFYNSVITLLSMYENENNFSKIENLYKLKLEPLGKLLSKLRQLDVVKGSESQIFLNYRGVLDDAMVDIINHSKSIEEKENKIEAINLKVLKSYYN